MKRRNRAKCSNCGDIIESLSVHHMVTCSCGAITTDGGTHYAKRSEKIPHRAIHIPDTYIGDA